MKHRPVLFGLIPLLALVALLAAPASATFGRFLFAGLSGFNEIPSVLSTGSGAFRAIVREDGTIDYDLQYRDLVGRCWELRLRTGRSEDALARDAARLLRRRVAAIMDDPSNREWIPV